MPGLVASGTSCYLNTKFVPRSKHARNKNSVTVVREKNCCLFSGNHTKHKRALFGQNFEFFKLKLPDVYCNVWALEG